MLRVRRAPVQVLVSRSVSNLQCSLNDLFGASAFHCMLLTCVMHLTTLGIWYQILSCRELSQRFQSASIILILYEVDVTASYMILRISKTEVPSFSSKTNRLIYKYKLRQSPIIHADSMGDMGIFLDLNIISIIISAMYFLSVWSCWF